jgi:hypothetical protein
LQVVVGGDEMYDTVRDIAAELEVPIGRMQVNRHRLQELFSGGRNG